MWKPDAAARKLIRHSIDHFGTGYAGIYRDGVIIWETRHAKDGRKEIEYTIRHVWPAEIPISARYSQTRPRHVGIRNLSLLLDGVDRVEVYYDSGSQNTKERGIPCTGIHLYTAGGMEIKTYNMGLISTDVTVSPDPAARWSCPDAPETISAYLPTKGDDEVVWHGSEPMPAIE
jgi:hypothetical protein